MNIMDRHTALTKLTAYFDYYDSSLLEIYDIEEANPAALDRGGYTGVTADYLLKYVVPNCPEDVLVDVLNELLLKKWIYTIPCSYIKRCVFEKHRSDDGHFRKWGDAPQIDSSYIKKSSYYSHSDEEE